MATSLEQAMYTYMIVVKCKDGDEYKSTGGGKENTNIKSELYTLKYILKDLDLSYQK
jgi:hypothetical protein